MKLVPVVPVADLEEYEKAPIPDSISDREEESVGNWSLLEDDKAAGCSLLLEERGASAGC